MKRKGNERGVALIAAVMVVAILAGIGISFAFNMRLEEKAAANYLWNTQAEAIARGGIERAIQRIIDRRDEQHTFLGNYVIGSLSVSLAPGGELWAHSEITILDEAGKVNINTSGHADPLAIAASFSDGSIGWTTAEIQLPPQLTQIIPVTPGAPPSPRLTPGELRIKKFVDGFPGAAGDDNPGWGTGMARFWQNALLGRDGIDNDGDGLVDELGLNDGWGSDGIDNDGDGLFDELDESDEGIDEPSEFRFLALDSDGELTLELPGRDRPFITVGETRVPEVDLLNYVTLHSRDRYLFQDDQNDRWWHPGLAGTGGDKFDLNDPNVLVDDILRELENLGIPNAEQVALNIVDFRDRDNIPTYEWGKRGIDRTLFINEIEVDRWWHLSSGRYLYEVDSVELINPWPGANVSGRYRVWYHQGCGDWELLWDRNLNFTPRRISYISRNRDSSRRRGGRLFLQYLSGGVWHNVEVVDIPLHDRARRYYYSSKNDPRVPVLLSTQGRHSLGIRNDIPQFNPNVGEEVPFTDHWAGHFSRHNRDFHNPAELGLIHTGAPWETVAMRDIYIDRSDPPDGDYNDPEDRAGNDGALLNRFTVNHPYNRLGRININTAEFDVLSSLPQMGAHAQEIIHRRETVRPFHTIGEVVPFLTPVSNPPYIVEGAINQLMQDIVNLVNWAIHWPSTWGWPLSGVGDSLTNFFATTLGNIITAIPVTPPIPFHNPPIGDPPAYITLEHDITIAVVEGIATAVANVTLDIIIWMEGNLTFWPVRTLSQHLINNWLVPIVRGANTLYQYTLGGDDLDGDGFYTEDDELETIVRSVSNLITVRSDRFEVVSTGSVVRDPDGPGGQEEEILAVSRMRAIVCRISDPDPGTGASNVEILHFERR